MRVVVSQQGKERTKYGQTVLKKLSVRLTDKYGEGWSVEDLKLCRRFYIIYSNSVNTVYPIDRTKAIQCIANSPENDCQISETLYRESKNEQSFTLFCSHCLVLMRIKNEEERHFYEIECQRQDWSVRQLKREYGASLYERLALSREKKEVLRLSKQGQTIEKPKDVIKDLLNSRPLPRTWYFKRHVGFAGLSVLIMGRIRRYCLSDF